MTGPEYDRSHSTAQQKVEEQANAALPGKADASGWRTLHPLSPIMRGGLTLLIVFGVIIANLRDQLVYLFMDRANIPGDEYAGGEEYGIDMLLRFGWWVAVLAVLVIVAFVVFFSWISWRFTRFRIADGNVELRQGVFSRKQRRAPLTRIQGVNIQRPLLARILGLSVVDVQTADSSGNVKLAYLSLKDAKSVRSTLLQTVQEVQNPGALHPEVHEAAGEMPTPHGSSAHGVSAVASTETGAAQAPETGQQRSGIDEHVRDFLDTDIDQTALKEQSLVRVPAGRLLASIVTSTSTLVIAVGIIAFISIAIIVREPAMFAGVVPWFIIAFSMGFNQINKGWGFTISPVSGSVRVGSGLTATTTDTIPLRRIHAIEISQPIIWRLFGWWRIRITTPGLDTNNVQTQRSEALPVGKIDDVLRVVATILPNMTDLEELKADLYNSRAGWVSAASRSWPVTWWAVKRVGVKLRTSPERDTSSRSILIRGGLLSRRVVVVPILRMQSIAINYPVVHRALGLARIDVHTVPGFHLTQVPGLRDADAREVFTHVAEEIVYVQRDDAESRYNQQLTAHQPELTAPAVSTGTTDAAPDREGA